MVEFVNLTPHDVVIMDSQGNVLKTIPRSGAVARLVSEEEIIGDIDGIPVVATKYVSVEGLPDPEPNKVYIVSSLILQALKAKGIERDDVVAPATGPNWAVRDENGRIIGVKGFQIIVTEAGSEEAKGDYESAL